MGFGANKKSRHGYCCIFRWVRNFFFLTKRIFLNWEGTKQVKKVIITKKQEAKMKQRLGIVVLMLAGLAFSLFSGCYSGDNLGERGKITGRVFLSDGEPVAAAKVSITGAGGTTELTTDETGYYESYFAANKAYAVKATFGTMASTLTDIGVLSPNKIMVHDMILVGFGNLKARVSGVDGNPVNGAILQLRKDGESFLEKKADASGSVAINEVPEGNYSVLASSPDGTRSAIVSNVSISGNSTTDLGTIIILGVQDGRISVLGTVKGHHRGEIKDLPGVEVKFANQDSTDVIATVKSGNNGIGGDYVASIVPGNYFITYTVAGYQGFSLSGYSLTNNMQEITTVVLVSNQTDTGGIKGRVISNDKPQDGVKLYVEKEGLLYGMTETALMGNGQFTISNLPSGNYTLKLEGPSIVTKTLDISVRAGEVNDLGDIQCGSNAGIKGNLKDQSGASVAGATVVLMDGGGRVVGSATSNSQGEFIFENITPAQGYKVEVSKDGYDTLYLGNEGDGFSVDAGFYTQVTSDSLIFYASLGDVKLTLEDTQINPALYPSGLSVKVGSKTQKTNATGQTVFVSLESGKSYDVVFAGNALYESTTINTGTIPTKKSAGDVVEKTINLLRKKSEVVGSDIKLSDTNTVANNGYVKICNDALLPKVDGEHCVTVPIVDGEVSIPDLPYGDDYDVTVHYSDDYNDLTKDNVVLDADTKDLKDLIGKDLVFTPSDNARAGIKVVVEANDGGTLSEVSVEIAGTVYKTNSSGIVETGNNLSLDTYSILVNKDSATNWKYGSKSASVKLSKVNNTYTQTIKVDRKTSNLTVTVKRQDNNNALANAEVVLGAQTVKTNASGVANFSNVKFDDYTLSASLNGYLSSALSYKNTDGASKEFKLALDTETTFIITANGVKNGDTLEVKSGGAVVKSEVANSNSYKLEKLVAGTYTVTAKREFFNDITSDNIEIGPDKTTSFTFNESGNGTDPGSRKKGNLSGKVALNDADGENVANATVRLKRNGSEVASKSPDTNGDFSFNGIYQDNYVVEVEYTDYNSVNKNITVVGNQSTGTLSLNPDYATVVFNVNANGATNANGALVSFNGANKTVASGKVTFDKIKKGSYPYSVSKPDFVGKSGNVTLAAGANKTENITIDAYGTVKGYVKQGTTIFTNAAVVVKNGSNQVVASPSVNAQGYLETKLPAGNYTIAISNLGFGYDNLSDSFTLPAGGVYDLQTKWGGSGNISDGDTLSPYQLTVVVKDGSTNLTGKVAFGGNTYDLSGGKATSIVQKGQTYSVAVSNLPLGYSNTSQSKKINNKAETVTFALTAANITLKTDITNTTFKVYNSANQLKYTKTVSGTTTFNVEPGSYKVEVSASGYISQTSGFQTAGKVTFDYTGSNKLVQYATVTGKVTADGANLSGATVVFGTNTVHTDGAGNFTITGISPATYNYTIGKAGYQDVSGSKKLVAGSNNAGTFNLISLGSLSGRVMSMAYCDKAASPKRLVSCNTAGARYVPSTPVGSAFLRLIDTSSVQLATATSNASGYFTINGPAGTNLSLKATKAGYWDGSRSGLRINANVTDNIGDIFVIDSGLLPPDGSWTPGIVKGRVVNAVTGRVINNKTLTVEIRNGGANGDIVKMSNDNPAVTTTGNGSFQIGTTGANLVPGRYYTIVLKDNSGTYQTASYDMIIVDGTTNVGTLAMTPQLPANEVRITLRWQSDGYDYNTDSVTNSTIAEGSRDLDGHLVGPAGSGFHVWYGYKTGHSPIAVQDIDDTKYCTYNGETITIKTNLLNTGTYSYSIHNYAKPVSDKRLFAHSHAVVVVYDSKGILAMQSIDPNSGPAANAWKVFEFVKKADGTYNVNIVNTPRQIANRSWTGSGDSLRSNKPSDQLTIEEAIANNPKEE